MTLFFWGVILGLFNKPLKFKNLKIYCSFRYRVWKNGEVVEEVTDVTHIQKENPDMVGFLLGCSFSFEVYQRFNFRIDFRL